MDNATLAMNIWKELSAKESFVRAVRLAHCLMTTSESVVIVGSQVYRTAAYYLHNTDRTDFLHAKANSDIDILLCEPPDFNTPELNEFVHTRKINSGRFNGQQRFSFSARRKGCPKNIDYISLIDIGARVGNLEPTILDYFNQVPLDIQAVALTLGPLNIIGPGVEAIKRREIRVNTWEPWSGATKNDVILYGRKKAAKHKGFKFIETENKGANVCTCDMLTVLMRYGCQCGGR